MLATSFTPLRELITAVGITRAIIKVCDHFFSVSDKSYYDFHPLPFKDVTNLPYQPLFSVVMPVCKPPLRLLQEALQSVESQSYKNWQIVIALDGEQGLEVTKVLEAFRYQYLSEQVIVLPPGPLRGIANTTNYALKRCSGDYILLLDHDDLLAKEAMSYLVDALNAYKDKPKFIYSDEDKIDEKGAHFSPFKKQNFDPVLLRYQNYICHLSVIKRDLILEIGGLKSEFNGAQDWEWFYRLTKNLSNEKILHLPLNLYHWRAHAQSTAQKITNKSYVFSAQRKLKKIIKSALPVKRRSFKVLLAPELRIVGRHQKELLELLADEKVMIIYGLILQYDGTIWSGPYQVCGEMVSRTYIGASRYALGECRELVYPRMVSRGTLRFAAVAMESNLDEKNLRHNHLAGEGVFMPNFRAQFISKALQANFENRW
jgi:glycosyltransferase involved in cell wall biosynthesis